MAYENLQIGFLTRERNTINYELSNVTQQRTEMKEELTECMQEYGQDSTVYQALLAENTADDASLEMKQNNLQITGQEIAAMIDSLKESQNNSIERIFG